MRASDIMDESRICSTWACVDTPKCQDGSQTASSRPNMFQTYQNQDSIQERSYKYHNGILQNYRIHTINTITTIHHHHYINTLFLQNTIHLQISVTIEYQYTIIDRMLYTQNYTKILPSGKLTQLLKLTIEIVDFRIEHGDFVIFHSYATNYQKVNPIKSH